MPQFASKPLSWFRFKSQARKTFDEDGLRRLGESMRVRQLQPVLAQPDGTNIAGERRIRAAQLIGLESLEVKIADRQLSDSEAKLWQLTENMQREDLPGYDQWLGCTELLSMNVDWKAKDLADHLHLDPSMITRLLSPSNCIAPVQDALKEGKVGISDCYSIGKLKSADQPGLLALKLSGASRDALEAAGRQIRNGAKPDVKVSRARLVLAAGISIVVSGAAISIEVLVDSLVEAAKQARKAREQGWDVTTLEEVLRKKSKGAKSCAS